MSYRLLKRRCWINSRVHSGMQVGNFHITGGGHLGKQRFTSHWTPWWTSATNDFVGALVFVEDIYSRMFFAIAATIPVVAYQTWEYSTCPDKKNAKWPKRFIQGLFILFIVGIFFGYILLFSIVLEFLTNMSAGQFEMMFTIIFGSWLTWFYRLGFLFEMPLVVVFLTWLGILNPVRLAKAWRVSYFFLVIVSIMITPPDFISDIPVIISLLVLYELSVTIIAYKKKV